MNNPQTSPAPPVETLYEKIEELPGPRNGSRQQLRTLARLLTERMSEGFFRHYQVDDLHGLLRFLLEEIQQYASRQSNRIRVINPSAPEDPWTSPFTVINLVTDDLPFVVDSIHEFLRGENLEIHYVLNQRIKVETDSSGELRTVKVGDVESNAFMTQFQIERVGDDQHEAIRNGIATVLTDIRKAVDDFEAMLDLARNQVERLSEAEERIPDPDDYIPEYREFMEFLIKDNFVFLGCRTYDVTITENSFVTSPREDRGILTDDTTDLFEDLSSSDQLFQDAPSLSAHQLCYVSKLDTESRVYRKERLDCVVVRSLDESGEIERETRFVGLFTNRVLTEPAVNIPILGKKFERMIEKEGISRHTHQYRDYYSIFNTIPKHVLFNTEVEDIARDIQTVIETYTGSKFRVRVRKDPHQRGMSVMVIMSKDRFNTSVRKRIQEELFKEFEAEGMDYQLSLGQGDTARLHFHLQTNQNAPLHYNFDEFEHHLYEMTRTWEDRLSERIRDHFPADEAERIRNKYLPAISEEYQALVPPELALNDILQLEELIDSEQDTTVELLNPEGADVTHLLFYSEQQIRLNVLMPLLTNHGLQVIEQSTIDVPLESGTYFVHLFRVQDPNNEPIDLSSRKSVLEESLIGVFKGRCRDDRLNAVVTKEGLSPKALNLFRLYKNYFHQLDPAYKLETINRILVSYSSIASDLFEFFDEKFDPFAPEENRESRVDSLRERIQDAIQSIENRTEDHILRSLFNHMEATVRTNFYQDDREKPYISVKIDCSRVRNMPLPRPLYEIYVYSPYMEAIHLRGGKIARGGIRWSDRRDDFRTEVLDLMKTQMVKNALIVPVGSKGGFVIKEEHVPTDDLRVAARDQYKIFMRGLLDLTDNRKDDEVIQPPDCLCYDGEDPYLVVAADKGTADFSDLANQVAEEYDYWLSDAFASGGSVGYDHKELGITARGAWECVKRHFRELAMDIENNPFTVIGIGDMSGDVFGNGMILSDHIRLLGAFNHRHIFLDPDPDPEATHEERRRLFEAESGWDAYDESLISEGGGVFDRNAKAIDLPEASRELLDLPEGNPNGEEIIRALLQVKADLLWNGGIGTYIKHPEQTHAEVGDPQNDECRVDADEVSVRVIGEGGNLGITQEGRIELDRRGVKLNTDAIDNSGGVDLSDHEVNLKVLLQQSIKTGELEAENREDVLMSMVDPIVEDVTRDNYEQSGVISFESMDSENRMEDFRELLQHLEDTVDLDRDVESLPDERELMERIQAGKGMTRPELAVIMSYVKMDLYQGARSRSWSEDWIIEPFLKRYFPDQVVERFPEGLSQHPLGREIALTMMVNYTVHHGGYSFLYQIARQLGAQPLEVMQWYLAADQVSQAHKLRQRVFELDNVIPAGNQYTAWKQIQLYLSRALGWLYDAVRPRYDALEFVLTFKVPLSEMQDKILQYIGEEREQRMLEHTREWSDLGFGDEFTHHLKSLYFLVPCLDILMIHEEEQTTLETTAQTYFDLGEILNIDWLMSKIVGMNPDVRWDQYAYRNLMIEINRIQDTLTRRILHRNESVDDFAERNRDSLDRLESIRQDIERDRNAPYSSYQFLVQMVRSLI